LVRSKKNEKKTMKKLLNKEQPLKSNQLCY